MLNFLSNALKFTPRGGKITINCELIKETTPHGVVEITVTDTGCGIRTEDQNKLFKMFGFLDRTKEINTKGIGLGLHICKLIAL